MSEGKAIAVGVAASIAERDKEFRESLDKLKQTCQQTAEILQLARARSQIGDNVMLFWEQTQKKLTRWQRLRRWISRGHL